MMRMEQHTEQRKCEPFYPVNQVSTSKMYFVHKFAKFDAQWKV